MFYKHLFHISRSQFFTTQQCFKWNRLRLVYMYLSQKKNSETSVDDFFFPLYLEINCQWFLFMIYIVCPSMSPPSHHGNHSNHSGSFLASPHPHDEVYDRVWDEQYTVPFFLIAVIGPLINFKSPTFFTKFNALGKVIEWCEKNVGCEKCEWSYFHCKSKIIVQK